MCIPIASAMKVRVFVLSSTQQLSQKRRCTECMADQISGFWNSGGTSARCMLGVRHKTCRRAEHALDRCKLARNSNCCGIRPSVSCSQSNFFWTCAGTLEALLGGTCRATLFSHKKADSQEGDH
jgi:hypothetical protein